MSKEDKIKELFAEKLGAHEVPVNPELWNAIASQTGTAATVTSTGLSVVAKAIIGISAASVIAVGTYFLTRNTGEQSNQQKTQVVAEDEIKGEEYEYTNTEEAKTGEEERISSPADGTTTFNGETPDLDSPENAGTIENVESLRGNEGKPEGAVRSNPQTIVPPFTVEPTPNLVGERPVNSSPAQVNSGAGKKGETAENRKEERTDKAEPVFEEVQASFEITKLPNVYVLNASGYFSIGYKGEYNDFQFTIMDSRNNLVFSSNQPDFEWRGTDMSGNQVEPGKYIYIVTAKDKDGRSVNKYSTLTVINQ